MTGPQRSALLGALAARNGRAVSFSELVDEMWGPTPPQDAPNALCTHVSRLRGLLRPPEGTAIVHLGSGYKLDVASESVDASVFEEMARRCSLLVDRAPHQAAEMAEAALDLWAGPAFAGAAEGIVRLGAAVRLDELRLTVVADLAQAHLRLDSCHLAVPRLQAELSARPGWEDGCALLMEALCRTGRRAEALEAYHRTQNWLRRHHGLDPASQLRQMSLAILRTGTYL